MTSYTYLNVSSDYDASKLAYFPQTSHLIDAASGNIKITFCDATKGNDASFFVFHRRDGSGLGLNTVTLATINGQVFSTSSGDVSSVTVSNNQTRFIICCNNGYRVL